MRFVIEGIDGKGSEQKRLLEADSEGDALAQAKSLGIYVTAAKPATDDEQPPVANDIAIAANGLGQVMGGAFVSLLLLAAQRPLATIVAGFVLYLVFVFATRPASQSQPTGAASSSATGGNLWEGKRCVVSGTVFGATSEATLEKSLKLYHEDRAAFESMARRGELIPLLVGTSVRVTSISAFSPNVRVRPEGSPDELWVSQGWID